MKAELYDMHGKKIKEIDLPEVFHMEIREDIAGKMYEAEKFLAMHPYSNAPEAGKRHSASGTISHRRHNWKGHYGHGTSRIPRKTMSRRGVNFFWIGAEVSSTRGGRRAHPPRTDQKVLKINKKEQKIAINSALAATAKEKYVKERYSTINSAKISVPAVIEFKEKLKAKDFLKMLKAIFGDNLHLVLKNKSVRAGKGKMRGRKYKSNSGLLLIKSKEENIKVQGIDVKSLNELSILDLYPLGRLTAYTEKAIHELGGKK